MKKILLAVFALVLTAVWAAPSFAVDASFGAQYRVRAFYLDNWDDRDDDAMDQKSYVDNRFRLGITLKEAPVTGYVQLQIGGNKWWGAASAPDTSTTTANTPTDTSMSVVARQGWLEFPVGPLGVKLGRTYSSSGFLGGGIAENISDRIHLSYKASNDLNLSATFAKPRESSTGAVGTTGTVANDNDKESYNIGFRYKPQGAAFDLGAVVYYVRDGRDYYSASGAATTGGSFDAFWLIADTNLKFDPINIYLSAALLNGESKSGGLVSPNVDMDLEGYAVHADVSAKLGPAKIGVVGGLGSGDDNTADKSLKTFFAPAAASYIQTHMFWQAGENAYSGAIGSGSLNTQNGSRETLSNITWGAVYADYNATDALSLGAKYAVFRQTDALAGTDNKIGNEIDLTLNYKIHKYLNLLAFAAWFDPDDGYSGKDSSGLSGHATTNKDDTMTAYYARLQWEF